MVRLGLAALSVVFVVGVLIASPSSPPQVEPISPTAWRMPVDVGGTESDADWIRLGWDSFVALNWPADNPWPARGKGGRPDKQLSIADPTASSKPLVWQTYLAPGQVFRENGLDPGPWNLPAEPFGSKSDPYDPKTQLPVLGRFEEKSIYFLTQNADFGLALYDLATTPNPVVDQLGNYVLLEVRLNQSEFDYFRRTGYYDARRQLQDTKGTGKNFVRMPTTGDADLPDWARQGAVEVKASWRILDPNKDIPSRYYTSKAFYLKPDGTIAGPVILGLVGLHILRNTPKSKSTWFWTTFEQVDNVAVTDKPVPKRPNGKPLSASFNSGKAGKELWFPFGFDLQGRFDYSLLSSEADHYNPVTQPAMLSKGDVLPRVPADRPVDCSRVTPIRSAVAAANKAYQQKLKGTVWEHYEMIDVMYPDPKGLTEIKDTQDESRSPKVFMNAPALVNTTMETYLTYKYSNWGLDNCQSCHYLAKPITAASAEGAPLQVFSYLYRRATKSKQ